MKPNDKAYEAARKVAYNRINKCFVFDLIKEAVDAAYAAQFQSEDYAGLISALRTGLAFSEKNNDAADALEALLAERDALKAELAAGNEWIQARATTLEELAMVRAERDALLARLAPVEDEALVEIVTREIFIERKSLAAAIAAIRPRIEAAERERCAKIAEHLNGWGSDFGKGGHAMHIAAVIRGGK